jgi:putative (di)nucleoside polyphosphate hydrolase
MNPTLNAQPLAHVVSCGTLIINSARQILLCHVTDYDHWDIPKGCMDPGETTLETACRELMEETGLVLDTLPFNDLGLFHYKDDKRLHLYQVAAPEELVSLEHLVCTSHFLHYRTGKMCPEMVGYRWAHREDIPSLCRPLMAAHLLQLDW